MYSHVRSNSVFLYLIYFIPFIIERVLIMFLLTMLCNLHTCSFIPIPGRSSISSWHARRISSLRERNSEDSQETKANHHSRHPSVTVSTRGWQSKLTADNHCVHHIPGEITTKKRRKGITTEHGGFKESGIFVRVHSPFKHSRFLA